MENIRIDSFESLSGHAVGKEIGLPDAEYVGFTVAVITRDEMMVSGLSSDMLRKLEWLRV